MGATSARPAYVLTSFLFFSLNFIRTSLESYSCAPCFYTLPFYDLSYQHGSKKFNGIVPRPLAVEYHIEFWSSRYLFSPDIYFLPYLLLCMQLPTFRPSLTRILSFGATFIWPHFLIWATLKLLELQKNYLDLVFLANDFSPAQATDAPPPPEQKLLLSKETIGRRLNEI